MPQTSTFAVTAKIAADLGGLAWPPHPTTGRPPVVRIGVDDRNKDESIVVRIRTADEDATAQWIKMSQGGRDERYIVDVWILSTVPGKSWPDMWARLEQLADVALAYFTDPDTGKFLKPGGELDDDGTNPDSVGVWDGMANAEMHNQWATDEGWAGECRIAVRIAALI